MLDHEHAGEKSESEKGASLRALLRSADNHSPMLDHCYSELDLLGARAYPSLTLMSIFCILAIVFILLHGIPGSMLWRTMKSFDSLAIIASNCRIRAGYVALFVACDQHTQQEVLMFFVVVLLEHILLVLITGVLLDACRSMRSATKCGIWGFVVLFNLYQYLKFAFLIPGSFHGFSQELWVWMIRDRNLVLTSTRKLSTHQRIQMGQTNRRANHDQSMFCWSNLLTVENSVISEKN